jgi:hypothetical protein
MKDIKQKLVALLRDRNQLKHLLAREKQRRGLPQDALAFIGMHNVALHWWCTQQGVLDSRVKELDFFAAYLSDRILHAHDLGHITTFPTSHDAILDTGGEISWADVELLLKRNADELHRRAMASTDRSATWLWEKRVDKLGQRVVLIYPDCPPEEKQFCYELARSEGIRVIGLEEDPIRRGEIHQALRAEKYPTIRWHFPWRHYSVGGVPDGLTAEFAYEYKTTSNWFLFKSMKPVATAQADLYAYFFRRPQTRVQIFVVDNNATKTLDQKLDIARTEATLAAFAAVDAGEPAMLPKPWKCRNCEFRTTCPISQADN